MSTREEAPRWEAGDVHPSSGYPKGRTSTMETGSTLAITVGDRTPYGTRISCFKKLTTVIKRNGILGKPPMALPEPHSLTPTEASLPMLKRETCTGNRFTNSSNGGRAGRKAARGACIDEVSLRFQPLEGYKYVAILPFLLFHFEHTTSLLLIIQRPHDTHDTNLLSIVLYFALHSRYSHNSPEPTSDNSIGLLLSTTASTFSSWYVYSSLLTDSKSVWLTT